MNVEEIHRRLKALKDAIGPRAEVFCSVDASPYSGAPLRISAYAGGMVEGLTFSVEGHDFDQTFASAEATWAECRDRIEAAAIQTMALEIIRLTHTEGTCTDAALRVDRFSDEDVRRYGERACAKANEMAAGGPFSIHKLAEANAE